MENELHQLKLLQVLLTPDIHCGLEIMWEFRSYQGNPQNFKHQNLRLLHYEYPCVHSMYVTHYAKHDTFETAVQYQPAS